MSQSPRRPASPLVVPRSTPLASPIAVMCMAPPPPSATGADPHVEWARQLEARPGSARERDRLEKLILRTPARTLAGVREQLAMVVKNLPDGMGGPLEEQAIENAFRTIDRLAAAG